MKDPEQFEHELLKPIGGIVTDNDLAEDEASFMAFASAMGVTPPKPPSQDSDSLTA